MSGDQLSWERTDLAQGEWNPFLGLSVTPGCSYAISSRPRVRTAFRHNFTFYLGFDPKQQGKKMDLDQEVSYSHSRWKHVIRGWETRFEVTGNRKLVLENSFHQNTRKIMHEGFGVFNA